MSKTVELARHLETLHINNMYKTDFYWTWDKTDEEIDAVFTVADALRDLRERNKNTKIFNSGLGISIFRDNSTRTRFSFASACNLLGLEEQVLDEKKSQIAHGETVRETANMVSFMADVIGIRDDNIIIKNIIKIVSRIQKRKKYFFNFFFLCFGCKQGDKIRVDKGDMYMVVKCQGCFSLSSR